MFVPGHQVHSDIAAAKEGVHAVRRRLAVGKVKEGRSSGLRFESLPVGMPWSLSRLRLPCSSGPASWASVVYFLLWQGP